MSCPAAASRLGIGSGLGHAVERMGFSTKRSLTALREAIAIIRALLRGEEVTFAGTAFNVQRVKLDYRARADIPIFMAARGPNAVKACGEIADGLIVSNMCAAGFIARSVRRLHGCGAGRGPRQPSGRGAVHAVRAARRPGRGVSRRQARHRRHAAGLLDAGAAAAGRQGRADDGSGISEDDFAAAVTRLKAGEAPDAVLDERFVEAFTIAGNADDCRAQAAAYAAAGVTELALTFFGPSFAGRHGLYRQGLAAS